MRCLFEDFNSQPPELKKVMDKWQDRLVSGLTYESARTLSEELTAIGYEFDMGLDAEPYGLRPIGVGIQELEGFAQHYDLDNESALFIIEKGKQLLNRD